MQSIEYNMLPQWIKNSLFIKQQDETDEIYLLTDLIIPDELTNEKFSTVSKSVRYFDSYPNNFWDYIKKINIEEINTFKETQSDSELEFVNLLLEFKTINENKLCDWAASKRKLDCLMYAHENGCPWDKYTCLYAAIDDHLECLKYAHENGCPWDKETCEIAASK